MPLLVRVSLAHPSHRHHGRLLRLLARVQLLLRDFQNVDELVCVLVDDTLRLRCYYVIEGRSSVTALITSTRVVVHFLDMKFKILN